MFEGLQRWRKDASPPALPPAPQPGALTDCWGKSPRDRPASAISIVGGESISERGLFPFLLDGRVAG